jgi:hypothetical protein
LIGLGANAGSASGALQDLMSLRRGAMRIAALNQPRRSTTSMPNERISIEKLKHLIQLPLNAADLLCSRPLTKTEERDTITSTTQADPLISEEFLS